MESTCSPQQYPIYLADEIVDNLTVIYERRGTKKKLVEVRAQDGRVVQFVNLWINQIPAAYLKGFRSSILPEEFAKSRAHRKDESDYFLDFEGNWSWLHRKRGIREIKLHILWQDSEYFMEALSCCRILWIKKRLEEEEFLGKLIGGEHYLLYYKNASLQDEFSIDQYRIQENESLEAKTEADLEEGISTLQKATGGSYLSIENFKHFVNKIEEKIEIVCQINIPSEDSCGTGFLIGNYLIMTNAHVVEDGLEGASVTFFYHNHHHRGEIEVDLYEEPVCLSETPGNELPVSKFDYAILRLKPRSELERDQIATLQRLNQLGALFFKTAFETFESIKIKSQRAQTKKEKQAIQKERYKRLERANIIQHPIAKGKAFKQIAFRENRVHRNLSDHLLLHYETMTGRGSSGSPVCNDDGVWIGLHYSACNVVNKALLKQVKKLFMHFQYECVDEDLTKFHFKREEESLFVFHSGRHKGKCSRATSGKALFDLQKFIVKEYKKMGIKISLIEFIPTFLKEVGERVHKEHIYCNTAIAVDSIFEDMLEEKQKNMEAKKQAGLLAEKEWSHFAALNSEDRRLYVGLSEEVKALSLGLSKDELRVLAGLSNATQKLIAQLSDEHQIIFLHLDQRKQETFFFLTNEEREGFINVEREEFIKANRGRWEKYKWPITIGVTVGLVIFAVGGIWFALNRRRQ